MLKFLKNFFSKKKKENSTKIIETKNGLKVELLEDQPDGLANMLEDCLNSGKVMVGEVDENGKFSYKEIDDSKKEK